MSRTRPLKIAMIAGEASGDVLGAGIIRELKQRHPEATFYGVGGPLMQAEGFESLYPMERLSVMGIVEVLGRIFELLRMRRALVKCFIADAPDLFMGIDAPDFNLNIEKQLKAAGIPTMHYVCPQVWAWREWRIHGIKQSVDHILALLPFEVDYLKGHGIPATYVGHSIADQVDFTPDQGAARLALGLAEVKGPVVGLLPGSRKGEIERLMVPFLKTARLIKAKYPDAVFIVPSANERRKQQIQHALADFQDLHVQLLDGQARSVMTAADALLVASGTAVLEAALHKKPVVMAYKAAPLSMAIAKRMVKVKYASLPNLLTLTPMIPEFIQERAQPQLMADALIHALEDAAHRQQVIDSFTQMHNELKRNASVLAVDAMETFFRD